MTVKKRTPKWAPKETKSIISQTDGRCQAYVDIFTFIPVGHANAIKRETLAKLTGLSEREIRSEIKRQMVSKGVPVINMQDGQGYFIPAADEKHLYKAWLAQERSRADSCLEMVAVGAELLKNFGRWEVEGYV